MITRQFILSAIAFCMLFSSCKLMPKKESTATTVSSFPDYIKQSNIYEVNVRQYSAEGTFKAFGESLPRLKEMGVEILWFMPITPISKVDRKGELGSYYAVADYTAVNPEFGTMEDWKALVEKAHGLGMKVITDWVATIPVQITAGCKVIRIFFSKIKMDNLLLHLTGVIPEISTTGIRCYMTV